ncbi:MAG: hypothetical protein C0504_01100 [Candidatus Solibacter sp.]|nr:hypothetical protein [Candidatus Solibacter sp.]
MLALVGGCAVAAGFGFEAEYLGGTLPTLAPNTAGTVLTTDPISFIFKTKDATVRIPFDRIHQIEYGQKVDRRVLEAFLLSPLFVLSKKRAHFVSIGFEGEDGRLEALVLRVDKKAVRTVLVSLEARSGRKVTFQDEEARRAGKG